MNKILELIKAEPALLSTAVSALITLAAAFGLKLSVDQVAAIGAVVQVLSGIITRTLVTPTSKTDA